MIRRESFPFKTRSEIIGGMDMARVMSRRIPPSSRNLNRFGKIVPRLNEGASLETVLGEERRRFKRQDESLARSLKKVSAYRGRLLGKVIKNRRLMELRAELQKGRYQYKGGDSNGR